MNEILVNPVEYGINADKIYYYRSDIREKFDLSIEELESIGIKDDTILVSNKIIKPLLKAQKILEKHRY